MKEFLKSGKLDQYAMGTAPYFDAQRKIIQSNTLLKTNYDNWYKKLLADAQSVPNKGLLVELGSGASYLKQLEPSVITTDVVDGIADLKVDARQLPFKDQSVKALFLTHVFHHIPSIDQFISEAERVLVPGGVISMIDVARSPFAKFLFSNLHPEPYNDKAKDWDFTQEDSMLDSNQALTWMVFQRDVGMFQKKFPNMQLELVEYLPWLSYLLSGGVTRKRLIPKGLDTFINWIDNSPLSLRKLFGLHWHIVVRKKM